MYAVAKSSGVFQAFLILSVS